MSETKKLIKAIPTEIFEIDGDFLVTPQPIPGNAEIKAALMAILEEIESRPTHRDVESKIMGYSGIGGRP